MKVTRQSPEMDNKTWLQIPGGKRANRMWLTKLNPPNEIRTKD